MGRHTRRAVEEAAAETPSWSEVGRWAGLAAIILGIVLGIYAWRESRVGTGAGASPTPVDADLAALERGEEPPDLHLRIGEHMALYPAAVYEYETKDGHDRFPDRATEVNYALYPVISLEHPYLAKGPDGALAGGPLEEFAVLVRTERFTNVGRIPGDMKRERSVEGLVINRIRELDSEERRLIGKQFPGLDLRRVLILDEGRRPTSGGGAMLMFVAAGVLVVGGAVVALLALNDPGRRRGRAARRR